jgi:hypothetical protein
MPSSFSRFLSDEELEEVRRLYLESLEPGESATKQPAEKPDSTEASEPGR